MTATVPGMALLLSTGHFIGGGAAGIIAQRIGGLRSALILAPAHGLVLSLLVSLSIAAPAGKASSAPAIELSDPSLVGALVGAILRLFS